MMQDNFEHFLKVHALGVPFGVMLNSSITTCGLTALISITQRKPLQLPTQYNNIFGV